MKTTHEKYDIIGDIHGHADVLEELLRKLDYGVGFSAFKYRRHKSADGLGINN